MRKYNAAMTPAIYTLRISPALKDALGDEADRAGLPLNEYLAQVLAEHLGRPELGIIPRKSIGRPRNKMVGKR